MRVSMLELAAPTLVPPRPDMATTLEFITPEMSAELLKRNVKNRVLRPGAAKAFAKLIKNNHYVPTHQGIGFDKAGDLVDGQHRLEGIVAAKIGIWINVTRNLDERTYKVIDIGLRRNFTDRTGLDARLISVAGALHRMIGRSGGKYEERLDEVEALYQIYSEQIELLLRTYACAKKGVTATMRAAVAVLLHQGVDRDFITTQFKAFASSDYGGMRGLVANLHKQIYNSGGSSISSSDHWRVFGRTLIAFDPENLNQKSLFDNEELVTDTCQEVRDELDRHLATQVTS